MPYYVYILTNRSRKSVYVGMTGDLEKRLYEHRMRLVPGFTKKYRLTRLVHFEVADNPVSAYEREHEIKGWRREKKDLLIERNNPEWRGLSEDWWPARKVA